MVLLLCWLMVIGWFKHAHSFGRLREREILIRWSRTYGPVRLNFVVPADVVTCDNPATDIVLIFSSDCESSMFVQHLLSQCQTRKPTECVRGARGPFVQDDDQCFRNGFEIMRLAYHCVPEENQFDICSRKAGRPGSFPTVFYYKHGGGEIYSDKKPCVCTILPNEPRYALATVYDFEPTPSSETRLHLDQRVYERHTEFDGTREERRVRLNGLTMWITGDIPPALLAVSVTAIEVPINVQCGLVGAVPVVKTPVVNTLHHSNATVTCQFSFSGGRVPLEKFGLSFSTETTRKEGKVIEDLENAFFCQSGRVTGSFIAKTSKDSNVSGTASTPRFTSRYQFSNTLGMESFCSSATYVGELTFTITILINTILPFDPEAKWHCFYQLYDWVQVSNFKEIPFPALKEVPTPGPPVGNSPSPTPDGDIPTVKEALAEEEDIWQQEDILSWLIPVAITGGIILLVIVGMVVYVVRNRLKALYDDETVENEFDNIRMEPRASERSHLGRSGSSHVSHSRNSSRLFDDSGFGKPKKSGHHKKHNKGIHAKHSSRSAR